MSNTAQGELIYLDNNATTRIDHRVLEAMQQVSLLGPLNPSSQHQAGRRARSILDEACVEIAKLLGADIETTGGDQLLITSGGTESNDWALKGLVDAKLSRWVSTIEHPSLLMPARHLAAEGFPVHFIPVDSLGRVTARLLETSLRQVFQTSERPERGYRGLVSIIAANNETGVLQDLPEITRICHSFGLLVHTDATQWIGKLPFDLAQSGVDAVTFTPHKFHGPCGVGCLLLRSGVKLQPSFLGGQQQLGLRAGTEPVALVVGMAAALRFATSEMEQTAQRISELRQRFEQRILAELPHCVLHSSGANRLPGTSCIAFPGVDRQTLLLLLDRAGVACSTGSACTSGSSEPSHVLTAMGVAGELVESSLRFGLSKFSTAEEVDLAVDRIVNCVNKLRNRSVVEK